MTRINKRVLLGFALAAAAGFALHSLYRFLPNPLTALIAPVRESIWEHLKILLLPYLAAALVLTRRQGEHALRPWLLSALLLAVLLLAVSWLWHIGLGQEGVGFDIGLYLVLMALGFLLPRLFPGPWSGLFWELAVWLAAALLVSMVLFTFLPPEHTLFADLTGAPTWAQIPW